MKLKLRISRNQAGALLMTVVIIFLIALTLVAYLTWSDTETRLETRSLLWNSALPLAEAGIEEALAHLNADSDRAANGWTLSGGSYSKQRTIGDGYFLVRMDANVAPTIISSGFVRVPPGNTYISRTITIGCRRQGGGGSVILSKSDINFSGGSIVDSFDSRLGPYTALTRKDGAVVMSNSGAADSVHIGTATVYGKAATGPGGTVTTDSSGSLGDLAWHAAAKTGIEAGTTSADVAASFPSNSPPTGAFFTPSSGIVNGTNYTYALGSGTYQTTKFTIGGGGSAIVTGDVELYVTSDFTISGSGWMWLAPGASLKIYVNGKFTVSGGGIANGTGLAEKLSVLGLNGNTTCTYSGSSAFIGRINCPNAAVTVSGSGGFYGAMTGNTVTLSGGAGVHYDEALGGGTVRYVVDSWNEWTEL